MLGLRHSMENPSVCQSVTMRARCLLFGYCFVLTHAAFSRENFKEQTTQRYWNWKGEEELQKALNLTRNEYTARNIILFVGDGMGPNTITASRIYRGGESSQLEFEKFPNVGLLKTYALDRTVPDSACSATALFSGIKTNFEVSGLDGGVPLKDCMTSLRSERRVTTVIDWALEAGKDSGFVTTTRVTHATPSALYSHSADRKWECEAAMPQSASRCKDIARQLIEDEPGRNIKVIMGGGRQCLTWNITNRLTDPIDSWACRRNDGRDLIRDWKLDKVNRKLSHQVLSTTRDLFGLNYENTDYVLVDPLNRQFSIWISTVWQYLTKNTVLGLCSGIPALGISQKGIFANGHMMYEDTRDKSLDGMPSLKDMTTAAIKILSKNKNGFVLMVEGGLIDYAHHRGYARRALEETVMFNEAVAEAVRLTGDDTLIIVTSDHSHNLNINGNTLSRGDILGIAMNSKADGVPYTTLTYSTGGPRNYQYEVTPSGRIQRRDPIAYNTTSFDYNQQAGILNDEATHGGVDVPVFATGPLSHLFHGVHEQTYVAHVIAYAAKIGRYSRRADVPSSCRREGPTSSGAIMSVSNRLIVDFFFLSLLLRV